MLGVGTAIAAWAVTGIEPGIIVGVLSGATTNTPSLAAGQQTLAEFERAAGGTGRLAAQPGLGYAVAYPFGVLGTILAMVIIRRVFGLSVAAEREALERQAALANPVLARANLEVTNPNVPGPHARSRAGASSSGGGRLPYLPRAAPCRCRSPTPSCGWATCCWPWDPPRRSMTCASSSDARARSTCEHCPDPSRPAA